MMHCVSTKLQHSPPQETAGQEMPPGTALLAFISPSCFLFAPFNHLLPTERRAPAISCFSSFSNCFHMIPTLCLWPNPSLSHCSHVPQILTLWERGTPSDVGGPTPANTKGSKEAHGEHLTEMLIASAREKYQWNRAVGLSPSSQWIPATPGGQRQVPVVGSQVPPFWQRQSWLQFLPKVPGGQAVGQRAQL